MALGTKFSVVGSNLVVVYKEVYKLFAFLDQVYPQDFADCLLQDYFRFLDDIFHKLLEEFYIKQFYDLVNSLQFIFKKSKQTFNFTHSLENIRSNELKQCFQNKTVQLGNTQSKNLQKILTKAKFEVNPLPPPVKKGVMILSNDSIYHRCEYFKKCKSFQFKVKSMV